MRHRVAAVKRGDPSRSDVAGSPEMLTQAFMDGIRVLIEEENGRIFKKECEPQRFTLSWTCARRAFRLLRLRPRVIRTVLHLQDRHIRARRKFAEEMLSGFGAWIESAYLLEDHEEVNCWIWTSFASPEKIFTTDAPVEKLRGAR